MKNTQSSPSIYRLTLVIDENQYVQQGQTTNFSIMFYTILI